MSDVKFSRLASYLTSVVSFRAQGDLYAPVWLYFLRIIPFEAHEETLSYHVIN